VNELRQELVARNLSSKGLKSQLLARLLKAVKSEQAKEEGRQDEVDENEEDVSPPSKEEDDKKFRDVSNKHAQCTKEDAVYFYCMRIKYQFKNISDL
jgi:hypothetical protein